MPSFKKSAFAVFATLSAVWVPSTVLAQKSWYTLFNRDRDSKSSKEPTNQPVLALNPNPTSLLTNRPTASRPSVKPSAKPIRSTPVEIVSRPFNSHVHSFGFKCSISPRNNSHRVGVLSPLVEDIAVTPTPTITITSSSI